MELMEDPPRTVYLRVYDWHQIQLLDRYNASTPYDLRRGIIPAANAAGTRVQDVLLVADDRNVWLHQEGLALVLPNPTQAQLLAAALQGNNPEDWDPLRQDTQGSVVQSQWQAVVAGGPTIPFTTVNRGSRHQPRNLPAPAPAGQRQLVATGGPSEEFEETLRRMVQEWLRTQQAALRSRSQTPNSGKKGSPRSS